MKDSDLPQDLPDNVQDSEPNSANSNTVGLKLALPVLGGLLLLVGLTAGALFYQKPGPQTTQTSAAHQPGASCDTAKCTSSGCTAGEMYDTCWVGFYTCPCGTDVSNGCQGQNGGTSDQFRKSASFTSGCNIQQIDLYCPDTVCAGKRDFRTKNNCNTSTCSGGGSSPTPTKTPTKTKTPTRTPTGNQVTPTRTPTRTRTPTKTKTPTRTPTGNQVTPTRTPTPGVLSGCESYTVHENSGTGSRFMRYSLSPIGAAALSTFCTNCDVEAMDSLGNTVYAVANDEKAAGARLCILNKSTGALSNCVSTTERLSDISFRSSSDLWGWRYGTGLVRIDLGSGAQTLVKSSSLKIEGITWNNNGTRLYAVKDATKELYEYNPTTGSLSLYTNSLPTTGADDLDFSPDGYLVGAYPTSGKANVFAFDIGSKTTKARWAIPTSLNNWDAFTAMCDLPGV